MKKVALLWVVLLLIAIAVAQTTSFAHFPGSESLQSKFGFQHGTPGCSCGIGPEVNYNPHFKKMAVSPSSVNTKVNTPVAIRFDASGICLGQSTRMVNGEFGSIVWQPGTTQSLPDSYGIATLSGYAQPKTDTIYVQVTAECFDNGYPKCSNRCTAKASIPVTITP